ncbi:MAG: DNA methyltransferase, partial [Lentilitoribacter sp.]
MPLSSKRKLECSNRTNAITIDYWSVEKLTLPKNRARAHSEEQIEKIKSSIKIFGFLGALLINSDGEIIVGSARMQAAQQLGFDKLPVLVAGHLSKAQIKAYRIADNKLAELSSWDDEILRFEFNSILEIDNDFSLENTGFGTTEIDLILDPEEVEEARDESVPDQIPSNPVSQRGDLWILGSHRLLCGDAKNSNDYQALLGPSKPDMIITDPPWNVAIEGHVGNSGAIKHREFVEASGEMSDGEFSEFLLKVLEQMANATKCGGLIYICIDWRGLGKVLKAGNDLNLELLNFIVWNKKNAGMGSLYRSKHELICLFKKQGAKHLNNVQLGSTGRYRTNVWDYAGANSFGQGRMDQLKSHPTAKPVTMIADAIKDVTKRGEIILDPFCGSGTTLLAAEK